jgi:hypothetical protein
MMEDILALIVVALAVAIMTYIVYRVVKKNRQATAEYEARQAKAYEKLAEMNRETTRKLKAEDAARVALRRHTNYGHPQFDPKNPDILKPRETVVQQKSRFQNEAVQSRREEVTPAPVSNWSNDLLTTMIISDLLTNHKDVSAGTVSWKDDTPTYKETYSKPSTDFGMDDSDSRKSASSSFSSSDSSSSWSDSSSSSSDSGPSSDW